MTLRGKERGKVWKSGAVPGCQAQIESFIRLWAEGGLEERVALKEEHPKGRSNTEFTALLQTHHTTILLKSLCQSENLGANLSQNALCLEVFPGQSDRWRRVGGRVGRFFNCNSSPIPHPSRSLGISHCTTWICYTKCCLSQTIKRFVMRSHLVPIKISYNNGIWTRNLLYCFRPFSQVTLIKQCPFLEEVKCLHSQCQTSESHFKLELFQPNIWTCCTPNGPRVNHQHADCKEIGGRFHGMSLSGDSIECYHVFLQYMTSQGLWTSRMTLVLWINVLKIVKINME